MMSLQTLHDGAAQSASYTTKVNHTLDCTDLILDGSR